MIKSSNIIWACGKSLVAQQEIPAFIPSLAKLISSSSEFSKFSFAMLNPKYNFFDIQVCKISCLYYCVISKNFYLYDRGSLFPIISYKHDTLNLKLQENLRPKNGYTCVVSWLSNVYTVWFRLLCELNN